MVASLSLLRRMILLLHMLLIMNEIVPQTALRKVLSWNLLVRVDLYLVIHNQILFSSPLRK